MQTLFYLPFFIPPRAAFTFPHLKAPCLPRRLIDVPAGYSSGVCRLHLLNQRYGSGDAWMLHRNQSVITMVLRSCGLCECGPSQLWPPVCLTSSQRG